LVPAISSYFFFGGILPTTLSTELGGAGLLAGGIVGAILAIPTPKTGANWFKTPVLRFPAIILIVAGLFYLSFGQGLPALYTGLFGQPEQRLVTVDHWRDSSRTACSGPQLMDEPLGSHTVCLDSSWKDKVLPVSSILVEGKSSIFGMDVSTAKPLTAADLVQQLSVVQ
jgi:hypothetical protein